MHPSVGRDLLPHLKVEGNWRVAASAGAMKQNALIRRHKLIYALKF